MDELNLPAEQKSVSPYNLAFLYAALGEKSKAVSLFEEAFKSKPDLAGLIKDDPRFDNIRSDPRFADLFKRYRIE